MQRNQKDTTTRSNKNTRRCRNSKYLLVWVFFPQGIYVLGWSDSYKHVKMAFFFFLPLERWEMLSNLCDIGRTLPEQSMTSTSYNTTLLEDTFSLHTSQETQIPWWIKLKYHRQQKTHIYIRCFLDGRCGGGDEPLWGKQYGKTDWKITGHGALCTCIWGGEGGNKKKLSKWEISIQMLTNQL